MRTHRLIEQCVLPNPEQHEKGFVARNETCEKIFLGPGAYKHGVRYDQSGFLFGYGRHVLPFQYEVSAPAEDVRVKAQVVLGDVKAAVDEYLLLEGTRIVWKRGEEDSYLDVW